MLPSPLTQAKVDADDLDTPEEELRAILGDTEPSTLHVDQELRQLERGIASNKAELVALRSQHEQVCAVSSG